MSTEFISGAVAGVCSLLSIYPTEYLKIKAQHNLSLTYKDIILQTYKKYGMLGFFKGSVPLGINSLVETSLRFGVYDKYKTQFNNKFTAGILTGIITSVFTIPTLNISKYYITNTEPVNLIILLQNIYNINNKSNINHNNINNNIKLFNGFKILSIKNTASIISLLCTYDILRQNYSILISGTISGLISCTITNPLDVLITKRQTHAQNISYFNTTKSIFNEFGFRGFYRGFGIRAIRPVLGRNVMFYVYEFTKKRIEMNK